MIEPEDKTGLPKKIKITKASQHTYWYSKSNINAIGQIFEVTRKWNNSYVIRYQGREFYKVDLDDCEVVES